MLDPGGRKEGVGDGGACWQLFTRLLRTAAAHGWPGPTSGWPPPTHAQGGASAPLPVPLPCGGSPLEGLLPRRCCALRPTVFNFTRALAGWAALPGWAGWRCCISSRGRACSRGRAPGGGSGVPSQLPGCTHCPGCCLVFYILAALPWGRAQKAPGGAAPRPCLRPRPRTPCLTLNATGSPVLRNFVESSLPTCLLLRTPGRAAVGETSLSSSTAMRTRLGPAKPPSTSVAIPVPAIVRWSGCQPFLRCPHTRSSPPHSQQEAQDTQEIREQCGPAEQECGFEGSPHPILQMPAGRGQLEDVERSPCARPPPPAVYLPNSRQLGWASAPEPASARPAPAASAAPPGAAWGVLHLAAPVCRTWLPFSAAQCCPSQCSWLLFSAAWGEIGCPPLQSGFLAPEGRGRYILQDVTGSSCSEGRTAVCRGCRGGQNL